MGRAARVFGRFIVSMMTSLLAGEIPHIGHREQGLQPPVVSHPDDSHRDPIVTVEDTRPQVEQAPPPGAVPFTPNQFPDPWISAKLYQRNSTFYNSQPDNTAVIWYAAEQARKAAQVA